MSEAAISEKVRHYAHGGQRLSMAVRGLTAEDMQAIPIPGKWSIQQVVIHLADAEMAFADRIKRIIATDEPVLLAWDQERFAAHLHYHEQSVEDAVTLVDLTRRQLARILAKLPESAFARAGQHNQRGRQTLGEIIGFADRHLDHHLTFINEKREKLGKLMW